MKQIILALFCAILVLTGCEEKPPVINFGTPITVDTTFVVSPVPASEPHTVLVEEYTGASCTNCPAAHEVLKEIQKDHPGRINVIGLYITGPLQSKPPHDAKYDFRHPQATLIANDIYGGVNILPLGGIDRIANNGSIKIERGVWSTIIDTRLAVSDSVNLKIESTYDSVAGEADIRATIVYTSPIAFTHNLSLVLVEDNIIDVQEYPFNDPVHPGFDENYNFTNVFRGMITGAPFGDPVLATLSTKEAGRVVVRNFKYKPQGILNANNCRVIGFVNSTNGGEYRILKSAQVKMK
jgi:hypothetical protein